MRFFEDRWLIFFWVKNYKILYNEIYVVWRDKIIFMILGNRINIFKGIFKVFSVFDLWKFYDIG